MYYFVIATDQSRYGPADVDTLVSWAEEGRLVASTLLVERGSEKTLRADEISAVAAVLRRVSDRPAGVTIERGVSPAPGYGASGQRPPPIPPSAIPHASPPGHLVRRVGPKSKLVAGLLGILLGPWGVHRFYLGYVGTGILQIVVTICTLGIGGLWGFIEGIICLCGGMRDADGLELHD